MANPSTRAEFKEYCLRRLGKPVININVADEQVEDRIDEALETYQEKHYDATEEEWMTYTVTQSDIDNGYITVPADILSVVDILPSSALGDLGSMDMFSYQYQILAGELNNWQPFDQLDYFMKMTNLSSVNDLLNADPRFRFVRHESKIKLYKTVTVDTTIIMRVFRTVDVNSVWNDKWLKSYTTALIKRQWGENTGKFSEVQLLGGVTINGERLYEAALAEIEKLEETLEETYQEPTGFIFG